MILKFNACTALADVCAGNPCSQPHTICVGRSGTAAECICDVGYTGSPAAGCSSSTAFYVVGPWSSCALAPCGVLANQTRTVTCKSSSTGDLDVDLCGNRGSCYHNLAVYVRVCACVCVRACDRLAGCHVELRYARSPILASVPGSLMRRCVCVVTVHMLCSQLSVAMVHRLCRRVQFAENRVAAAASRLRFILGQP